MAKAPTLKALSQRPYSTCLTPLSTPCFFLSEQTDEPVKNRPCGLQGEESEFLVEIQSSLHSLVSKKGERCLWHTTKYNSLSYVKLTVRLGIFESEVVHAKIYLGNTT